MRNLMPTLIGELQSTHELRNAHTQTLLRAILVELKRIVAREVVDSDTHSHSEHQVQAAVRALAFKWIRILYRCWQTQTPYNEALYLKALKRRGSPLLNQMETAIST